LDGERREGGGRKDWRNAETEDKRGGTALGQKRCETAVQDMKAFGKKKKKAKKKVPEGGGGTGAAISKWKERAKKPVELRQIRPLSGKPRDKKKEKGRTGRGGSR